MTRAGIGGILLICRIPVAVGDIVVPLGNATVVALGVVRVWGCVRICASHSRTNVSVAPLSHNAVAVDDAEHEDFVAELVLLTLATRRLFS